VYIRYFWQENHQIYGHIRCIYGSGQPYISVVLVNPVNMTNPAFTQLRHDCSLPLPHPTHCRLATNSIVCSSRCWWTWPVRVRVRSRPSFGSSCAKTWYKWCAHKGPPAVMNAQAACCVGACVRVSEARSVCARALAALFFILAHNYQTPRASHRICTLYL